MNKIILIVGCVLICLTHTRAARSQSSSHTQNSPQAIEETTYGRIGPNDRLIYSTEIKTPATPNVSQEKYLKLSSNLQNPFDIITAINITDLILMRENGMFYMLNGGVGKKFLNMQFGSKKGKAMAFNVDVYGN